MCQLVDRVSSIGGSNDAGKTMDTVNTSDVVDLDMRRQSMFLNPDFILGTVFRENMARTLSHGVPSFGCHCNRLANALATNSDRSNS
jgi:hypothetical protein